MDDGELLNLDCPLEFEFWRHLGKQWDRPISGRAQVGNYGDFGPRVLPSPFWAESTSREVRKKLEQGHR